MSRIDSRLPEGRAGQALAIAAPLCLVLAIIFGLIQPAVQWYGARQERLVEGQEQVAHILAVQDFLPQLRRQASAAARSGKSDILLVGDSDAIADANLQAALTTLANASGASLTSAAVSPPRTMGSLRQVGIEVDVTASWPALATFLTSIESARPRMIVDDLSINGSNASGGSAVSSLQASFTVSAFRAGQAP